MIANLDLASLAPHWEAGYAKFSATPSIDALAESTGGYVDTIGGRSVVWTPQHSYLIPTDENHVGFLRPSNRSLLLKLAAQRNATPC